MEWNEPSPKSEGEDFWILGYRNPTVSGGAQRFTWRQFFNGARLFVQGRHHIHPTFLRKILGNQPWNVNHWLLVKNGNQKIHPKRQRKRGLVTAEHLCIFEPAILFQPITCSFWGLPKVSWKSSKNVMESLEAIFETNKIGQTLYSVICLSFLKKTWDFSRSNFLGYPFSPRRTNRPLLKKFLLL